METRTRFAHYLKDIFLNVAGITLYSIGINCFAKPHNIAPGGASGLAILIYYVVQFPIGLFVLLFNIPLLIIMRAKKLFSTRYVCKVLASTMFLSVVTDGIVVRLPVYQGDALLASLLAGGMMGIGLALVHIGESNTGGISLIGLILQKIYPRFHVGSLMSGINMLIVLASGLVFGNIENVLYAVIVVYISGLFMDRFVENVDQKNLILVMSDCTDRVRQACVENRHDLTVIKGAGGYSNLRQRVLLSIADKKDCEKMQRIVMETDPNALVTVLNTSKVQGKGFRSIV